MTVTRPDPPRNLNSLNPTATTITITWDAGASNGGAQITEFFLNVYTIDANSGSFARYPVKAFGKDLTGLTPGQKYTVTVQAVNSAGTSDESDPLTFTMYAIVWIRVDGKWKRAEPWVRHNGTWQLAIPYIRHQDTWKQTW